MKGRLTLAIVALLLVAGGCFAIAYRPPIDPVDASRSRIDPALVATGAALAGLGNCASCHTVDGGAPYAGGVPIDTPFGTIHGTNLTPDPATGIGGWSEAAFVRAMREGVSRDGHLLYPAFPYPHFTHTTDADLHALYAYLMTRDPVHAEPPRNALIFPLRFRPLIAGWNLLFFTKGDDASARRQASADHGAYLVESLGHCGACHTPLNALGAEEKGRSLAGAVVDGWYAPPLETHSPSPQPWTVEAMTGYLRTGLVAKHAIAGGPMQRAVAGYADALPSDIVDLSTNIVSRMGPVTDQRTARANASAERAQRPLAMTSSTDDPRMALGATVYATTCAGCHDRGRGVDSNAALRLPLAVALYDDDPHSFVRLVRDGVQPPASSPGRYMPAYGTSLSDEQLIALGTWLRKVAADAPAWPQLEQSCGRRDEDDAPMTTYTLSLNGTSRTVDADPETPLLYVLRDDLGLHGAKFGCGLGQCGACTVMIDREAAFSCLVPIALVGTRSVTTVEGLGTADRPGRVQQAFIDEQAAQCGYCIAGMIMRAEALLARNPHPGDDEIRRHMSINLCRCGTHMRILRAVARAAGEPKS